MSDALSDEDLARLVQNGDETAYAEIMDRYSGKLLRYGRRFLSAQDQIVDVVQDVFVSVYEHILSFDGSRRFSPWIYRIAHNAFVNAVRTEVRGPLFGLDFDRILPHPVYEDPDESEKEKEAIRVLLEKHLEEISPAYREIIDLFYYENFKYHEIADILHIPIGTVGIRLARARQALKKRLDTSQTNI